MFLLIYKDKIDWNYLCFNPNAIDLLKKNQNIIVWYCFSSNPNVFKYDYKKMIEVIMNSGIDVSYI